MVTNTIERTAVPESWLPDSATVDAAVNTGSPAAVAKLAEWLVVGEAMKHGTALPMDPGTGKLALTYRWFVWANDLLALGVWLGKEVAKGGNGEWRRGIPGGQDLPLAVPDVRLIVQILVGDAPEHAQRLSAELAMGGSRGGDQA